MAATPMQVLSVDSQVQLSGIKCVVYGASGIGKTRLVLTCPRPLVLSAERGLLSIRGNNVPQLPEIRTLADLVEAHNFVLNNNAAKQFDTVFVDSITEIAEVVLRSQTSNDGRKKHGDTNELVINTVFRHFRDLPNKHVVMICKERQDLDEYTKITQSKPDMPNGKLRTAIPGFFDFVFRYVQGIDPQSQQRWAGLQTLGDASGIAKDRSGRLAPLEPPHLGQLFHKAMQ